MTGWPLYLFFVQNDISMSRDIEHIAARLMEDHRNSEAVTPRYPVKSVILQLIKQLQQALFPGYFETGCFQNRTMKYRLYSLLDEISAELAEQVYWALHFSPQYQSGDSETVKRASDEISLQFLSRVARRQGVFGDRR